MKIGFTASSFDLRIGHSHTFVDVDYTRGWGGYCFPKDTAALLKMSENIDSPLRILKTAVEYNSLIKK